MKLDVKFEKKPILGTYELSIGGYSSDKVLDLDGYYPTTP